MTFEEWYKINQGSYIVGSQLQDKYGDYVHWELENILRKAYNDGFNHGWNEAVDLYAKN